MGNKPPEPAGRPRSRRVGVAWLSLAGAILWSAVAAADARAVTPDSPEVRQLVASGLKALEESTDDTYGKMLGGKCVVGLAFVNAGQPEHPRVEEAVAACRQAMTAGTGIDVYSNGLAIIFLCELNPRRYAREVQWYLRLMRSRQKPNGGWGYDGNNFDGNNQPTGDTSQTQFATLCYWTAHRNGYAIDGESLEDVADWLLRTQAPDGCWGYQGVVGTTAKLVPQTGQSCSMLAAGLGGTLICADLLNTFATARPGDGEGTPTGPTLPEALRPADENSGETKPAPKIQARRTDAALVYAAIDRANAWMKRNYKIDIGAKTFYYMYALERYKSFQELLDGQWQEEPQWYNDGFRYLKTTQAEDGSWTGICGRSVDTAFAVLFLLRSTQKSIRARLGEGMLLSGRGLPPNLSRVKMRGGQIVVQQVRTKVDEFLSLIDDDDLSRLDDLAHDPSQLMVSKVDAKGARQLEQLVRGGEPEVRLLAVRALGRTGNLDYVPSLIYGLSDPDRRVVLEARNGLRFISRRFGGFGLPDDFTDQQRFEAISAWKEWYQSLRPDAVFEP